MKAERLILSAKTPRHFGTVETNILVSSLPIGVGENDLAIRAFSTFDKLAEIRQHFCKELLQIN